MPTVNGPDEITTLTGSADKVFYTDSSGDVQEVSIGTDGQTLVSTGATAPEFDGLTGLKGGNNTVLYTNPTGNLTELALSATAGDVLTSNGAAVAPTFSAIPASGGTKEMTATGAIAGAGISVSLNADGTVSTTADNRAASGFGTVTQITSHTSNYPMTPPVAVYNSDADAVVVFWIEDDTGSGAQHHPKTAAASISGSTLTFGAIVDVDSSSLSTSYTCGIQYDPVTHKMWYMWHTATSSFAYLAVGTVSGTTITITAGPTATTWSESSYHGQNTASFIYDTDTNQMIAMFGAYYTQLFVAVVSESGGTITVGTATTNSTINYRNCTSACYLPDVSRLVVYSGSAGTRTIMTFSISGTTITADQADSFAGNGGDGQYAAYNSLVPTTDGTKVLTLGIYYNTGNSLEWNVATITAGAATTRAFATGTQPQLDMAAFSGAPYSNAVRVGTTSSYAIQAAKTSTQRLGTWVLAGLSTTPTLTLNGAVTVNTTNSPDTVNAAYGNSYTGSKVISVFRTNNTNDQIAAALYSPPSGTTTATEFIGISEAAISGGASGDITVISGTNTGVSGLTAGQTYFLQADGSLATTKDVNGSVTANYAEVGKALSSTSILISGVGDTSVSNI